MLTQPSPQLIKSAMALTAENLKTSKKRKRITQIGRHPTENMRVKFAPPLQGRRFSQLEQSMESDTTSIQQVDTSSWQAPTCVRKLHQRSIILHTGKLRHTNRYPQLPWTRPIRHLFWDAETHKYSLVLPSSRHRLSLPPRYPASRRGGQGGLSPARNHPSPKLPI